MTLQTTLGEKILKGGLSNWAPKVEPIMFNIQMTFGEEHCILRTHFDKNYFNQFSQSHILYFSIVLKNVSYLSHFMLIIFGFPS
jgi:hypothetical protein